MLVAERMAATRCRLVGVRRVVACLLAVGRREGLWVVARRSSFDIRRRLLELRHPPAVGSRLRLRVVGHHPPAVDRRVRLLLVGRLVLERTAVGLWPVGRQSESLLVAPQR